MTQRALPFARLAASRAALLTALFALACTGCSKERLTMTADESSHVLRMTRNPVEHCVGRHVLSLPSDFQLNADSSARIEDVEVRVEPMSLAEFNRSFEIKKSRLLSMVQQGTKLPHVRRIVQLPDGSPGGVFDRAQSNLGADRLARTLELLGWKNGYLIHASIKATDTSFPEDADDSIARQLKTDVDQRYATLVGMYQRIRGRQETEMPGEAGLCIANGFVAGAPSDAEEVNVSYNLRGSPDLYFDFNHTTKTYEQSTMLQRSGQIEEEAKASKAKTLRKGKVTLAGQSYEEWLWEMQTPDRVLGNMFTLHGNETANDPRRPYIELTLYNGYRVPAPERTAEESAKLKDLATASLTSAEAEALWSSVSATLRPRPGAF